MTEYVPKQWWRDGLAWFGLGMGAVIGLVVGYWVAMEMCR